jgi:flagellar assembly protein FliH
MTQTSPFQFATEFSPDGEVLSGPARKYFSREEADQLAAKARADGEARAKQATEAKGFASVDRIVVTLAPVAAQLSAVAEQLRADAAELAMIAAKRIAGAALDRQGEEAAAAAIADVVRQLKLTPVVTVAIAPDSIPAVERRLEQLRAKGVGASVTFAPDPAAKPGDWRVEWAEGSTGFSRDAVEAAIDKIIKARLQDPVAPQLDLFAAA